MKKIHCLSLLLLACFAAPASADGFYAGAGVLGVQNQDKLGQRFFAGYYLNPNISLEGEYFSHEPESDGFSTIRRDVSGWSASARYAFGAGRFRPFAKIGAAQIDADWHGFFSGNQNSSTTTATAELGVLWRLAEPFHLRASVFTFSEGYSDAGASLALEVNF